MLAVNGLLIAVFNKEFQKTTWKTKSEVWYGKEIGTAKC